MPPESEIIVSGNKVYKNALVSQRQIIGLDGNPLTERVKPMLLQGGTRRTAGADVAYNSPEIQNPLLNPINFYLPYSSKILNQWARYWDRFNPLVGNCLDLHGYFPISKSDMKLKSDDSEVLYIYERCADDMDLFNRELELSREYELIGECYPFLRWNDEKNHFDAAALLNPDFIQVKMHLLALGMRPIIELEPDELLKTLVNSNDPEDMEIKQELDPVILAAVAMGQNIRIDPFNIDQIARKASPYEPRGTSIVLRIFKALLYMDKLINAQMAIADGLITPKIIYKLGDPQNGYMPTQDDLIDFRTLLQQQAHDPLGTIIYHYGLDLQYIGAVGKILPIIPELEWCDDQILTGLYTSKALVRGEGATYNNATVAMRALEGRYLAKREKIEEWEKNKIWKPVAIANEFYEPLTEAQSNHRIRPSQKERKLNLPTKIWKQKLNLIEDTQKQMMLMTLRGKNVPEIALHKICDILGIDYDENAKDLKDEATLMKKLREDYGANSPLIKQPGEDGKSVIPASPLTKPFSAPVNSPNAKSTTKEPIDLKTVDPTDKMKGASWKSSLSPAEINAEKDKMLQAWEDPSKFLDDEGHLKPIQELRTQAIL